MVDHMNVCESEDELTCELRGELEDARDELRIITEERDYLRRELNDYRRRLNEIVEHAGEV